MIPAFWVCPIAILIPEDDTTNSSVSLPPPDESHHVCVAGNSLFALAQVRPTIKTMLLEIPRELFELTLDFAVDDDWNQPGNIERALSLRLVCSMSAKAFS